MKVVFQILFFLSFMGMEHLTSVIDITDRDIVIDDPCNEELIGTECNDWDACTIDDRYDANCECVGIFLDSDNDGICDANDLCEGSDDGYDEDNDTIPDGCDDCNNNDTNLICSLPEPCTSIGGDSSFEYIDQVSIGNINNNSGNNNGYKDFQDQVLEVNRGSLHEITLVPGYASGMYNEAWNIWVDYNKDGAFDNDTEKILSITQQGKITSTILIPANPISIGLTRMRISMQYNNDAEPCQDVTFGEVEDYYVNILSNVDSNPCKEISYDDFDLGYGEWEDGGSDCSRIQTDENINNWSIRLRDNSSTSTLTSPTIDLSLYHELDIDFQYIANSMEQDEDFWFQISMDDGKSYSTIKSWSSGKEFENGRNYNDYISIHDIKLTDKVKLRWRCDATANADQVYLDNISIVACVDHEQEKNIELTAQDLVATAGDKKNKIDKRQELQNLSFDLVTFPNPATDRISLKITQPKIDTAHGLTAHLINMYGKSIKHLEIDSDQETYSFDVGQIENGMYLITINNNYGIIESQKVMIMK